MEYTLCIPFDFEVWFMYLTSKYSKESGGQTDFSTWNCFTQEWT